MQVGFKETSPFQGWRSIRRTGWAVGPLRALRWLLTRVHAEMGREDGTFRGDGVHNYVNHPLAARMGNRCMDPVWPIALSA